MSLTHNELRMMLKSSTNLSTFQPFNFSTLYTVCEIAATALFLAGWAVSIITHF